MFYPGVSVVFLALVPFMSATDFSCPGASVASSLPGTLDCSAPTCSADVMVSSRLFPHEDPRMFYQCGPGLSYYEMHCAPGTCFSPQSQVCVHPFQWKNSCKVADPPVISTEKPEETTSTTTTASTTSSTTTTTSTSSPVVNYSCPGATVLQHLPGTEDCTRVPSSSECNTLTFKLKVPTKDPLTYYECTKDGWTTGHCNGNTCFNVIRQNCISAKLWVNVCRD